MNKLFWTREHVLLIPKGNDMVYMSPPHTVLVEEKTTVIILPQRDHKIELSTCHNFIRYDQKGSQKQQELLAVRRRLRLLC